MTILDEIIAYKKTEVKERRSQVPFRKLEQSGYFDRNVLRLTDFLADEAKTSVIAEFKKKSPSKGMINGEAIPAEVAKGYEEAGASGISVLTDRQFFGGSPEDLISARNVTSVPLLRKDFVVDEYQVVESRAIGADVILLIAACLTRQQLKSYAKTAKSLGLQVIMEVHKLSELSFINESVDIVGVNNRDLETFKTDINTSAELIRHIPAGFKKISESGIDHTENIRMLKESGYDGFLIGELFMKKEDPVRAFIEFVKELQMIV
ncbi:MAG: indole-3-glycerol phosphate synthase TrpC [Bacteroidales bacterium]|nr:indole-3-glycerol phosphate synthase TrpC [Bacteroidales bacterium]